MNNEWITYLFIFLSFWACVVDDNFDDHGFDHAERHAKPRAQGQAAICGGT